METTRVQHVNKASSDELLRKFAEHEGKQGRKVDLRLNRRRKRLRVGESGEGRESPVRNGGAVVERKSLLPRASQRSALLRQLRVKRAEVRAREILFSAFFLAKLEKTWRKTVEGASKMLLERHRNHHVRLRNEVV
ncbi:hypothetical protein H6P81_018359 [Aristolochia fimbriata]|uniref:Uncharacterized protein n=1 Tax=Aristolochia fimbriata TaxID=158543 RepID=A0AAV7E0W0_ARIFI|nr:hypothetical protein H6P81_018359 [Aristolochia fimbriata]